MKTDIETIKENIETLAKDENVLRAVSEALMKKLKIKEPEEGQKIYYLGFDGEIVNIIYNKYCLFAWRTKQLFLTLEEAEDYKRFLLIEAQIREIGERIDYDGLKYYLKNNHDFKDLLEFTANNKFANIIYSKISADDLKFYFEYER